MWGVRCAFWRRLLATGWTTIYEMRLPCASVPPRLSVAMDDPMVAGVLRACSRAVMRTVLRSFLAAALAIGFASAALADKRVALIVANGAYKGAPLENPTTDADLVAKGLTNVGFAATVVKDADLVRFDSAVNAFVEEAKGA